MGRGPNPQSMYELHQKVIRQADKKTIAHPFMLNPYHDTKNTPQL